MKRTTWWVSLGLFALAGLVLMVGATWLHQHAAAQGDSYRLSLLPYDGLVAGGAAWVGAAVVAATVVFVRQPAGP